MKVKDIPGIDQLSTQEKILLVEELWDSIAVNETNIPIPQSHISELERRAENIDKHPESLLTLEELQTRVNSRK